MSANNEVTMKRLERDLLKLLVALIALSVVLIMEKILFLALMVLVLYLIPSKFYAKVTDFYFDPPTHVGDDVMLSFTVSTVGIGYARISLKTDETVDVMEGNPKTGGFVPLFRRFRIHVKGIAVKRGKVNFGVVDVKFDDIFLLKESAKEIRLNAESEVRVRVRKVRKIRAKRRKVRDSYPDIDLSKIGVPGTDFREIREYMPGDPVKFINWKATAKKNEILVNKFEVEGKRVVWFVVNTSLHPFAERDYLENALETAASLAHYFTKRGHKTALTLTGTAKTIYPDLGKKQFNRIIRELTIAEFGDRDPVVTVNETKKLMMYHMPFVIYITNIHDDLSAFSELIKSGLKSKMIVIHGKDCSNTIANTALSMMLRHKMRMDADVVKDTVRVRI